MSNRVLSIEIGNSLTKICEMDYKVKKPRVYKCLSVRTPENTIADGILQPSQEFADSIMSAVCGKGIKTRKTIFSISSARIASREVQIPSVKSSKIESIIKANAADYFPIDLQQYEVGYHLLESGEQNSPRKVMALAVPHALLDSYYRLAEMCGMEIVAFDYSSNSLYQIIKSECGEEVTMVLKVDETSTIVAILREGKILMQRTVAYGVEEAIESVISARAYDAYEYGEAVSLLRKETCINHVLSPGDAVWQKEFEVAEIEDEAVETARQGVTSALGSLIGSIVRVVDYYNSRNTQFPVKSALVTGLGGDFKGMGKLLENCLEMQVTVLNQIEEISFTRNVKDVSFGEYIACLGAVISPVGLVDREAQKTHGITLVSGTNYTVVSGLVLALGVVLAGAFCINGYARYAACREMNENLTKQLDELAPVQQVYNEYLAAKTQYDKYVYLYHETETPNENLVAFINELETVLPGSFYTNSFASDETGISMSVTVEGKAAAARTIKNIRDMESIEDVTVSGINDTIDQDGKSQVTFSITGTYREIAADKTETEAR